MLKSFYVICRSHLDSADQHEPTPHLYHSESTKDEQSETGDRGYDRASSKMLDLLRNSSIDESIHIYLVNGEKAPTLLVSETGMLEC